jgi:glycosyltransferase involved in cell wall biosynthesis
VIRPIIFWECFPVCGLLLKSVVKHFGNKLIIVATRPLVPFSGLEQMLGHKIIWLDSADDIWERKEEFADRNFILHTGWNHKGWLKYDSWVKKRNNAVVVVAVDNNFKYNYRQRVGSIYFKLFLSKYFDAAFVPGREGQRLMKFFGMPEEKIYVGYYGAFEKIYKFKKSIEKRKNEFLYVGQLSHRKSVDILIDGFSHYKNNGGTWRLRIVGDGDLSSICNNVDGVIREGFLQPIDVVDTMNDAKVFILISREEHWGTVMCEAAACGMNIITYKEVGSSVDIVRNNINGIVLDELNYHTLSNALFYYENLNNETLSIGSSVSKGIAKGYDSTTFYSAINKMIYDFENIL